MAIQLLLHQGKWSSFSHGGGGGGGGAEITPRMLKFVVGGVGEMINTLHATRHLSDTILALAVILNKLSFRLTTLQTVYW